MTGQPCRVDRAQWLALVQRQPLDRATRLVAGALGDRANAAGLVPFHHPEIAASCCLGTARLADAMAALMCRGLIAWASDTALVLTRPGGAR
jgi:hypothetical protein